MSTLALAEEGRLQRFLAFIACTLLLLSAAALNGYPLLFPDSGNYMALSIVAEELPYRTLVYAALLTILGTQWTLWGAVVFQALCIACVLDQTVSLLITRHRPLWLLSLTVALVLLTGLPWYVGQIMPDVFTGALVLAAGLLVAFGDRLPLWRRMILAALMALGTAIHASHLPVALALVCAGLLLCWVQRRKRRSLVLPALALAAGTIAIPAVHYLETGRAYMHKGGDIFLFARLVEDGIVARYLNEHCPLPDTVLCAFKNQMPTTHNGYLWEDTQAFDMAGGWDQSGPESQRIMLASLRHYPLMHLQTALRSFGRQLVLIRTGDYLRSSFRHNAAVVEIMLPWEAAAYHGALQQRRLLRFFDELNWLQVPIALAACLGLAWLVVRKWRRDRSLATFCLMLLAGLLANALACGILSNPQDRYQNRVVWIAVLAVAVVAGPSAFASLRRQKSAK
ncbi:MAG: hypothetical protein K0S54_3053 [Alphaproteobacteria bacterium]|nr:hypothetical protein [Alphaproteobacteria bacterium]